MSELPVRGLGDVFAGIFNSGRRIVIDQNSFDDGDMGRLGFRSLLPALRAGDSIEVPHDSVLRGEKIPRGVEIVAGEPGASLEDRARAGDQEATDILEGGE